MVALKKELFAELTKQGDLRMNGKGAWYESSPNPYGKTDEMNFYQKVKEGEKIRNRSKEYERLDLEDGM